MNTETTEAVSILDLLEKGEDITNAERRDVGVDRTNARHRPLLASPERMCAIFEDVVMQFAPDKDTIERMRTTEQHIDPVTKKVVKGHRYRVERGFFPVEGFVGVVTESQFATFTVPMAVLERNQSGTFFYALQQREQPSGDWKPVAVQTRLGTYQTKNGRVPANFEAIRKDPTFPVSDINPDETVVEWIGQPGPAVYEVGADCMYYTIVWMDLRNAPDDAPLDANGNPRTQTNVTVQTGTDPALVKLLERMADRPAPTDTVGDPLDSRVTAVLAEMEAMKAQLANAIKAAPPAEDPEAAALRAELEETRRQLAAARLSTKKAPKDE